MCLVVRGCYGSDTSIDGLAASILDWFTSPVFGIGDGAVTATGDSSTEYLSSMDLCMLPVGKGPLGSNGYLAGGHYLGPGDLPSLTERLDV